MGFAAIDPEIDDVTDDRHSREDVRVSVHSTKAFQSDCRDTEAVAKVHNERWSRVSNTHCDALLFICNTILLYKSYFMYSFSLYRSFKSLPPSTLLKTIFPLAYGCDSCFSLLWWTLGVTRRLISRNDPLERSSGAQLYTFSLLHVCSVRLRAPRIVISLIVICVIFGRGCLFYSHEQAKTENKTTELRI